MRIASLVSLILFIFTILLAIPIKQHNIEVVLNPSKHYLKGTDSIVYDAVLTQPDTLYLSSNLKIKSIQCAKKKVKFQILADSSGYNRIIISPRKNAPIYSISYEGTIYFALQGRNLNQGHDFSRGMISDAKGEGIFLPAGSFYPIRDREELTHFEVKANCPKEFTLITSGFESSYIKGDSKLYKWNTQLPNDGMTLCGNRFTVTERIVQNKRLAVYLLPEDEALSKTYLDAMQDIYTKYTSLLGEYPFSSFSMVENFFASGYGMPNYTLLAKDIVKMPFIVTAPGSLAHEFCHNWWGNSVFVKQGTGNWCESLTTFCANYYWYEITGDKEKQVAFRKKAIFEVNQLPAEKNYALADFHYQRNDDDAVIGYQKGSMFLYEIYDLIGKEAFFKALRQVATDYKGLYATWVDLENNLIHYSPGNSLDIHRMFSENLHRLELPKLQLSNVVYTFEQMSFELRQKNPSFTLHVPVQIQMENVTDSLVITLRDSLASYQFSPWEEVRKVIVDPEYKVLRAISEDEMPYNMTRVMSANPLIILPTKGEALSRLQMLTVMLKQSGYEFTALPADSVTSDDLRNRNLFILGKYQDNEIFHMLPQSILNSFSISNTFFEANGTEYTSPLASMLFSYANPFNPEKLMTLYIWNSDAAVPSFRKIFHYQDQSWQVFDLVMEQNKPRASGDLYFKGDSDLMWEAKN
jgi:aminopeptidase N